MTQEQINRALEWRSIWADNSDYTDTSKGMLGFTKTVFPEDTYNETPAVHLEIYRDLLQLFNPRYRFLEERQLQLTLPRGISKSTITNVFFMTYVICFNGLTIKIPDWDLDNDCLYSDEIFEVKIDKSFIVLISETSTIAETWVTRVKGELSKNKWLTKVFGNMKHEYKKDDDGKWTKSAFSVSKQNLPDWQRGKDVTVVSKGSGMQLRGINIKGRPDLEIWDDLYSLNNTKTEESRHKVRYFATAEAKDGIDPVKGAIVSLATVVHEDTIPVDNEKSRFWHTIKRTAMDVDLFQELLDKYCKIDRDKGEMFFPDRFKCKELQDQGYNTIWPDRITLEMLFFKLAEKIESRSESMFWQEYFHIVISKEDKVIKPEMIITRDIELVERQIGGNWYSFVKVKKTDSEEYEYHNVRLAIAVDAATSYKTRADNSAIVYIAKDYYGRIYVLDCKAGKFAFSDEIVMDKRLEYGMKLCLDRQHIERIGTADELFRMVIGTHHRPIFIIETNNAGGELIKQVKVKMQNYAMQYQYMEVVQTRDKEERILDTLKPYYQSKSVIHNRGQEDLVHELEYLGKASTDDRADALACAVANIAKPNSIIDYRMQVQQTNKYVPPSFIKNNTVYRRSAPDWVVKH